MPEYIVSPFIHSIESHLEPENVHQAVFHQLTGEVFVPLPYLRDVLTRAGKSKSISFDLQDLPKMGEVGMQVQQMLDGHILIGIEADPFIFFLDHLVVRPIQNPALSYRSETNQVVVVRVTMERRLCSPMKGQLPPVIEEVIPSPAAEILLQADGAATLRQLFERFGLSIDEGRSAVEFLTEPERQLIKLTCETDLDDPDQPFNAVPRNLYHAARWQPPPSCDVSASSEFHTHGIEDAEWEFNLIEPTVNHSFRFPSAALGGLEYGARFYRSAMANNVSAPTPKAQFDILEVGGGTGTFACSFLKQAKTSLGTAGPTLNYKILELSPVLAASQQELLTGAGMTFEHVHQDAVSLSIPDHKFDLVILNEVVADFPISWVHKRVSADGAETTWDGEGATYVAKYNLTVDDETQSFRINSGVFEFIERAWEHLSPGGRVILSEYGSTDQLPLQMLHLNHEEFSIHFGHVKSCAEQVGFVCRLLPLAEFLEFDEQSLMLAGHDEHIVCLNHILRRFDLSLPFAAITKADFDAQFQTALERIQVTGPRFLPLSRGFYFGPRIDEFMVLIMSRP